MTQQNKNRESYNHIVSQWDCYRRKRGINKCIAEFCRLLPRKGKILDAGCGTGYPIAQYLSSEGFTVVGIDISENMIMQAEKLQLKNASFFREEFLSYDSTEKFDGIIAFDSLWHIEEEKQACIYKKAAQLLGENGYFVFTHGITKGTVTGEMFSHKFVYSALDKDEVKMLLYQNGFTVTSWQENYCEETTGMRELLVIARKRAGE